MAAVTAIERWVRMLRTAVGTSTGKTTRANALLQLMAGSSAG